MSALLAKAAVGIITRLITEAFLAKLTIQMLRAWARGTANIHDDKVVEAMADALGVEPEALKEASK
jgi:2-hydroxychromene-2-carboxylate isomerase